MGEYYTCDISFVFNLNKDKCNYCMNCVYNCPYDSLHFQDNEFIINIDKCSRCETCAGVCSANAIDVKFEYGEMKNDGERVNQKIFITNIRKESTTGVS